MSLMKVVVGIKAPKHLSTYTGRRELHDAQQMLNKSPAYRESNPVAAGGAAAGGTGIVSAVRVAGLQQYEELGLNVEFPLRIGHFAAPTRRCRQ
jgi:hypothetical protein